MTFVPVDKIKTDRVLSDTTGLTALSAKMKKGDYKPILLLGDMTLVDGLRRIAAAKLLGWTEVDALVTGDLFEIRDYLAEIHKDGPPHLRRIYEFYPILKKLVSDHHAYLRNNKQWTLESRTTPQVRTGDYVQEALNTPYRQYSLRVNRLYKAAERGDEFAIELIRQVDAGEIFAGTAYNLQEQRARRGPHNMPPAEQRTVIEESIRSLAVVARTLKKLDGKLKLTSEDAAPLMAALQEQRSEVYSIISRLAKEARDK